MGLKDSMFTKWVVNKMGCEHKLLLEIGIAVLIIAIIIGIAKAIFNETEDRSKENGTDKF